MAALFSSIPFKAGRCAKALLANGLLAKPCRVVDLAKAVSSLPASYRAYNVPAQVFSDRPLSYEELLGQIEDIPFRNALASAVDAKIRQEVVRANSELAMFRKDLDLIKKAFDAELFRRDRQLEAANREIMLNAGWWNMKGIMELWSQQNNSSHDWKELLLHHDDLLARIKKRTDWDDETTFRHVEKMFNVINDPYHEKLQTSTHEVDIVQGPVNRQEAMALSSIALYCRIKHRLYLAPADS